MNTYVVLNLLLALAAVAAVTSVCRGGHVLARGRGGDLPSGPPVWDEDLYEERRAA
jgi:hypothetical protein